MKKIQAQERPIVKPKIKPCRGKERKEESKIPAAKDTAMKIKGKAISRLRESQKSGP
jgi:hypothetical protein